MPGFGPRVEPGDRPAPMVDRDAAASVAAQLSADAYAAGRAEADWDIAAGMLSQNEEHRARMSAEQERAAYGPGGRARFADPRVTDFPGRGGTTPEREAEPG